MGKWRWRAYALTVLMGMIGTAATAGCGAQGRPDSTAPASSQQSSAEGANGRQGGAGAASSAKAGSLQEDELQSRKDKLLVVTFAALLQLDKKPGLAITAAEAQKMMPIVNKGKEQGELSPDDQRALDAALTAQQAKFVADFRSRIGSERRNRPELTPEQRDAMIAKFKEQRQRQPDEDKGGDGEVYGDGGKSNGSGGSVKSGGRTIEQQLIDVLEAKLKVPRQKP